MPAMVRSLLLSAAFMLMSCSAAPEAPAFPYFNEEGGRVRDMAKILSPETEALLTAKLDRAERAYGPQMAVVTVQSLEGYDIAHFSLEYSRAWKLGNSERNDGLQLMVAPNERKVRIEVGKGIEDSFTDLYCKDVLDNVILPRFRDGEMDSGIVAGTEELIEHMRLNPTIQVNDNGPVEEREAA
jgi:uncharacterized protein